jgi:O-methyltransferase
MTTTVTAVSSLGIQIHYLELVKKCLLDYIYADVQERPNIIFEWQKKVLDTVYHTPGNPHKIGDWCEVCRMNGLDIPSYAHTMIGYFGLENVQDCVEEVIKNNIPGDLMETGVWRGGATILMRAVLLAYGITDRKVWCADSFEGLPIPDCPQDSGDPLHDEPTLAVSLEQVKENFAKYWLLDEQVMFLKGWFKDTLPTAPIDKLAVLRLDGDTYASTMTALEALYPKLSVGGFLIVDDYGAWNSCRQAITDYRQKNSITDEIMPVDWTRVYWMKTK